MTGTRRSSRRPPRRTPNPVHRQDYERLRRLLLQWRTDAGLSQRALAIKLGKSLGWVNRSETGGRRMDALEWVEWVGACGLKPEDALKRLLKG